MAIFHSKSHFNSAQSHLLVEEKRRNNQPLVLLLLSVRIASLKNARNESSAGDCDLGLSKRARLSDWGHGRAWGRACCTPARCLTRASSRVPWREAFWMLWIAWMYLRYISLDCKVFGKTNLNWSAKGFFWSIQLWITMWLGQQRGCGRTWFVG